MTKKKPKVVGNIVFTSGSQIDTTNASTSMGFSIAGVWDGLASYEAPETVFASGKEEMTLSDLLRAVRILKELHEEEITIVEIAEELAKPE